MEEEGSLEPWLTPGAALLLGLSSALPPPGPGAPIGTHTTGAGTLLGGVAPPASLATLPREEELRLVGNPFTGSLEEGAAGRAGADTGLAVGLGLEVMEPRGANPEGRSVDGSLGIP